MSDSSDGSAIPFSTGGPQGSIGSDDAATDRAIDLLRAAQREGERLSGVLATRFELNRSELRALELLEGQTMTPTDVAGALEVTTGSVTPILDRLAERGYLSRKPNPSDRRSVLLALTDQGRQVADWVRQRQALPLGRAIRSLLDRQRGLSTPALASLLIDLATAIGAETRAETRQLTAR